jgi:hypothetical protein
MAETFGLVAAVFQVSSVGLALSIALCDFAGSVSGAEQRLRTIAKDVELTSRIVSELGRLFDDQRTQSIVSEESINLARDAVAECDAVFQAKDGVTKLRKNGFAKWTIYFRESKIDLLHSNLDRLKANLQLLMQVVTHAMQLENE